MSSRLSMGEILPGAYIAMDQLDQLALNSNIDPWLIEMIRIRASLINGCAYCVDCHTQDAIKLGIAFSKIALIPVWREAGAIFTEQEQAILLLTEEVTLIHQKGVSDHVYNKNIAFFGEEQTAFIIMSIISINAWNRIGVGLGLRPASEHQDRSLSK
jgi:AhpD family alkylhydroperoxidase